MTVAETNASVVANREALQGLAGVLLMVAGKLQTQGEAARQVSLLVPRAEELALRMRALCSGRNFTEAVAVSFANEIDEFIGHTIRLAEHASHEAATAREVGGILQVQADELNSVGHALNGDNDMALIRGRLRTMLSTLMALPQRLRAITSVAKDVAELGDRAMTLADSTQALRTANGRNIGIITMDLYRDLRDFADTVSMVAAKMSADAKGVNQAIAKMSERAQQLATPDAAAETAITRMETVLSQGNVALERRSMQPSVGLPWRQN